MKATIKFNKLTINHKFLEECTRKANKGLKKYKKLNEKGLKFGKNVVCSKGTEKETQPLYFKNKFQELIEILG